MCRRQHRLHAVVQYDPGVSQQVKDLRTFSRGPPPDHRKPPPRIPHPSRRHIIIPALAPLDRSSSSHLDAGLRKARSS